jgi:hypothetical protein
MSATGPRRIQSSSPICSEHLLQLFDSPESLGEAVARFFASGLERGDPHLLIAKPAHVQAVADALGQSGHPCAPLVDRNRIIVLDAGPVLRLIMKRGVPNIEALGTVIENTRAQLAPRGGRIRIYGELVEVLAEEGNLRGAEQIEAFWNEFGCAWPIALFCGYSSAHFVMPGAAAALTSICDAHDRVLQCRQDLLATWLLARRPAPSV